jgi:long-chain fatty acid transport protein
MSRQSCACVTVFCVLAGTAEQAAAQGYGVYEQGACAMARAGAAVASPCADGSAIFFNPAAIATGRDGSTLSAGGTLIGPRGDF